MSQTRHTLMRKEVMQAEYAKVTLELTVENTSLAGAQAACAAHDDLAAAMRALIGGSVSAAAVLALAGQSQDVKASGSLS